MADITYFVALPFVAADDGIAPGEPVECLSARAAILRAEYLSRREGELSPDFGDGRAGQAAAIMG
jgi:hypothetical protein